MVRPPNVPGYFADGAKTIEPAAFAAGSVG